MKTWCTWTGCGMIAMALMTASAGENDAAVKPAPAAKPEAPQIGAQPAAPKMDPAAGKPAPFSPEMSAEFMRKVMETSARIEAVKQEIAERQAVLFETHPDVKAYRAQLIEMQKEINKILDADADLGRLKMSRDLLWTTMPRLPRAQPPGAPGRGFSPLK